MVQDCVSCLRLGFRVLLYGSGLSFIFEVWTSKLVLQSGSVISWSFPKVHVAYSGVYVVFIFLSHPLSLSLSLSVFLSLSLSSSLSLSTVTCLFIAMQSGCALNDCP